MTTIIIDNEFKDNLAAISGEGSLIKLDVDDKVVEKQRLVLVREYGFDKDCFNAALFIYACNVLNQYGLASEHPLTKKVIIAVTAKMITEWFTDIKLMVDGDLSLDIHLMNNIGPDWPEEGKYLGRKVIKVIENDMSRVFRVWYDRSLNF